MNERRRGFISGVLTTLLVLSLSLTGFAAAQTISVNGGVKLMLDGKSFVPTDVNGNEVAVFEYNGTTYVPVRAISQAYGKEVAWDGTTRTVIIGSNASSGNYNRQNPAPIGKSQTITLTGHTTDYAGYQYTVTMTVKDAVRGEEAWKKIKEANRFNTAPPEGYEYILATINATVDSTTKDIAIGFYESSFDVFSSGNTEYSGRDFIMGPAAPNPTFSASVYEGATLEGYAVFQVAKDDIAPKIVYGADYNGAGGIWFRLG